MNILAGENLPLNINLKYIFFYWMKMPSLLKISYMPFLKNVYTVRSNNNFAFRHEYRKTVESRHEQPLAASS